MRRNSSKANTQTSRGKHPDKMFSQGRLILNLQRLSEEPRRRQTDIGPEASQVQDTVEPSLLR